jgi:transposase
MPVMVMRTDLSTQELRAQARRVGDVAQARRLLAIALVVEGASRAQAAEAAGMTRQTLRDWVHRYNEEGVAGLTDRPRSGRPAGLNENQLKELDALVEAGPDIVEHGVVRWRCVDLRDVIADRFEVTMSERHVGRLLRKRGFSRLSARPRHPKADEEAQEAFKKNFADILGEALPDVARGRPIEIWFQDEARVGQKGTLTRLWARRGSRPRAVRDTRYQSAYIFGAICPARGVGAALILPRADTEAMNLHLAEISAHVADDAHAALVLDGAGWHGGDDLAVPENITLLVLPPYSPELNPVENIWEYLRQNKLANRLYDTYEDIVEACCEAWNDLVATPNRITSIANREWANVS